MMIYSYLIFDIIFLSLYIIVMTDIQREFFVSIMYHIYFGLTIKHVGSHNSSIIIIVIIIICFS